MKRREIEKIVNVWIREHIGRLALFNILLMLMVLLRSAGYFSPFFPLSINTIIFFSMILAIFLLDFRGSSLFFVAIVFLILAAVFRVFSIEIWAERAGIYMYQAIFLAVVIIFIEGLKDSIMARFRKL